MTKADGQFADHFGPFGGRCWFDTAHQGPMPRIAVQAATKALAQRIRPHEIQDADFFDVPERLRQSLGKLVGAEPKDIILGNSTTYGLDLLANGIRWRPDDEILLVKGDFPADISPWSVLQHRGVTIRFCEPSERSITAEALEQEFSRKTRLFCTSWVNSFTGYAVDIVGIGQVCRNRGVLFVLNASQALGARALDLRHTSLDAITCCGYKWLCGPYGTGFCWLTPSLRDSLLPLHAYWLPMQAGRTLDDMRDAKAPHDLGARAWDVFCTANFLNFLPWTACINLFLAEGPERISSYDESLVEHLLRSIDRRKFEVLSPESGSLRSTLIVARPLALSAGSMWRQRLYSAGIDVALREENLRIAPHLHNTMADVDRLLNALDC
jgi:selenocysteine lyase/cysteine desulfurase